MEATFITRSCPICHAQPEKLRVTLRGIGAFNAGGHADACFPELTPEQRERVVSGVCGRCMTEFQEV